MGLGTTYYKIIKKEYYKDIPMGLLILNWIVQRIFRINSEVPFSVHYTSKIVGAEYIKIHPSVRVSFAVSGGVHIVACKNGNIEIGEGSIFAHNVCIQSMNHDLLNRKKMTSKPISIGKNCWLGNSVTIVSGATLGNNVTVGANSVVTKSFPDNVVIAGVPAKVINTI